MAADITSLLSQSSCLQCLSPGDREIILLSLLSNIAGSSSGTVDITTLLANAQCFACLSEGERAVAEIALLSAIATAYGV